LMLTWRGKSVLSTMSEFWPITSSGTGEGSERT
jgi:hypothetical protein